MNKAKDIAAAARYKVLRKHPGFTLVLLNWEIVETDSVPYAATDGKRLLVNPKAFSQYAEQHVVHELAHCIAGHPWDDYTKLKAKLSSQDAKLLELAMEIKADMIVTELGYRLPPMFDFTKYADSYDRSWSTAAIYWDLKSRSIAPPTIPLSVLNAGSDSKSVEESKKEFLDLLSAGIEAEKAFNKGDKPGNYAYLIKGLFKPKIAWQHHWRYFIHRHVQSDYTWMVPNRRWLWQGIYYPAIKKNAPKLTIGYDDSGSITWLKNALETFHSEVVGLMQSMPNIEINLIVCDAEVQLVKTSIKNPSELPVKLPGGGGTDFRPLVKKAEELECPLVVFTDGYGDWPEKPPKIPVLWIMTTDVIPPFNMPYTRIEIGL
jgi:predicted metal-dependent peptidase